jgi:RNA polymerase sigma-70 factor (ECF subfamily)
VHQENNVPQLIEHLFRHQAGQMVSSLTRFFGVENLQLAEDVVQETLLKALQQWSYRGVPENPQGWLWRVAKNNAFDILRRQKKFEEKIKWMEQDQFSSNDEAFENPLLDDSLRMLFLGCHPSLPREMQIPLLLKTLSGFSVEEISRGLLVSETAIAQRLVRAKNKLRDDHITFDLPPNEELINRLDVVLEVLYFIFNEGYDAHIGNSLVRKDLCDEAVYLCKMLAEHSIGKVPKVYAVLALMLLQGSRLNARTDAKGNLLILAEQNRDLWDQNMIHQGLYYLGLSAEGNELSEYHLQAGIAAKHAVAVDDESTAWVEILSYYESIIQITSSPVVRLNHVVAIAKVQGTKQGLEELNKLKNDTALQKYHLLYATLGELYERSGDFESAKQNYLIAIELTTNKVEQRFLEKKLEGLAKKRRLSFL